MKNYWILAPLAVILIISCKDKKNENRDLPISAISIIRGQLNKLDSSLYAFIKLEKNGNKMDTTFLKREEIRKLADPFLSLPDIAEKESYKKYDEERLIDAQQETLSITSTLKDSETAEIQKQMLIIDLSDASSGKVQSIFIETYKKLADTTIEQKLFWEIDKYFTILTEKGERQEKSEFVKVQWQ